MKGGSDLGAGKAAKSPASALSREPRAGPAEETRREAIFRNRKHQSHRNPVIQRIIQRSFLTGTVQVAKKFKEEEKGHE